MTSQVPSPNDGIIMASRRVLLSVYPLVSNHAPADDPTPRIQSAQIRLWELLKKLNKRNIKLGDREARGVKEEVGR